MSWIVQNMCEGPLCITDVGITMNGKGQLRDLDLIGRDNAERSNDIKVLLLKGFIRTVRKDAAPPSVSMAPDPKLMEQLKTTAEMATKANEALIAASQQNTALQQQLDDQRKQNSETMDLARKILEEVRGFAKAEPLDVRVIKEALDNIKAEKLHVARQIAEVEEAKPKDITDRELEAHEKILKVKEKKLEKNFQELGHTISKSAEDVDDVLGALEDEGIF